MATRVDFFGRLDGKTRTPQGGLRVDANLTRTGVFLYRDAAGQIVREYRPPEEVFKADSLETLKLAPLTIGHPASVRTDNYREVTVGVVAENVRARDHFVASDVLVQDKNAIDRVDAGELLELSCGYEVDLDRSSGVTPEGERYDAVQRNIRYNHVALGAKGWGRAGANVRLHVDADDVAVRLDASGNVILDDPGSYSPGMPTLEEEKKRADTAEAERDALKSELDKTKAKLDSTNAELVGAKALGGNLIDPNEIPKIVAARVSLETSARSILGADASFTKKDSKGELVPMTDDEVMTAALAKVAPDVKLDGKSGDYLRARFDAAVESTSREDAAHGDVQRSIDRSIESGGQPQKTRLDDAYAKAEENAKAAAQGGPPAGALVRK